MANRRGPITRIASFSRLRTPEFLRLVAPWIAILVIASGFHFYRNAPVDGVIYLLLAIALTADAAGLLAFTRRSHTSLPPRLTLVIAAIVLGVPLVITPRYGITDFIIISAIGIGVLIAAWPDPALLVPEPESPHLPEVRHAAMTRGAVLWACIGVLVCLWELAAYFLGRGSPAAEYAFPPLSDLVGPMLDSLLGRVVLVGAWLAGGIGLLNRGRST